jgi:hypothetical protein
MERSTTLPLASRVREAMRALAGATRSRRDETSGGIHKGLSAYGEQFLADVQFDRLLRLGVITVEFALIVVAVQLANIETEAFEMIATLALGGFLVHHFLPAAWRLNFFAALSVTSVPLVFGWDQGAWLLAIGGLLIALCHLPVAPSVRIGLLLVVGVVLIAGRKQVLPWGPQIPATIWPILGSMFMFRLIIYVYDLSHGAGPFSIGRSLSYFFMLPNVCFPLFPVVDYKTLQRSAYNDDPIRLYQTGVRWMLRGLVQLTLYKAVYFLAVVEPDSVVNGMGAARYMVSTYLLYLKISGLFHLIVGLLHMFGFGLAETHHMYLFSSSFTDFWRRINIYWKDFIQKLVFNPAYFWLRKSGETRAIAVATLIAFSATWFLHSYQWFWIRGEFPIIWADLVFWLGLGVIVLVNVMLESRKGRQRALANQTGTLRDGVLLALKIAGTFTAICILWTIWSTPNLEELGVVWLGILNSGPLDLVVLLGIPAGIGVLGAILRHRPRETFGAGTSSVPAARAFYLEAVTISVIAGAFILIGLRPTLVDPVSPTLATLVQSMRDRVQLNSADSRKVVRGYYEDLGDVTRFNDELWSMYGMKPPDNESLQSSLQTRQRNDSIGIEYIPSSVERAAGAVRTINSLGLRDREYPLKPGPNTFRIALVGSSNDMGWGVNDNETYENLVEDRLNRELGPRTGKKFEILNFSVHAYRPTQKLSVIEQRIFSFQPNVILYVASTEELEWMFKSVRPLASKHFLDQFSFLLSAMERANIGVESLPNEVILQAKLAPFAGDTLRALLGRFRDGSLSRGIRPAFVILELPRDSKTRDEMFDRLVDLGKSAELPTLDLQGAFAEVRNRKSLWVFPWDDHINAEGHRLLADRLYALLLEKKLVPVEATVVP